ncbi:iron ABC transporter permease [Treponema sp.]|uniref:FecCD family ABC transporter permease n=1 Tax=Treponema sp. TaxID=166 RepID=UPI0025DB8547|nr:iron ABC transporter permease [Treponema sp.]MCR5217471.1 iron ABC transporter permease [Treponema sp.]
MKIIKTLILFFIFIAAVFCSLLYGAQRLDFLDLFSAEDNFSKLIFFQLRLPRTILVCLAGALLAGSGAVFQGFFRNPLADPGIMGLSGGSTLGAVIACAIFSSTAGLFLNIGALCGALGAGFLVTILAFNRKGASVTVTLLLCGTALASLYSAFISIILAADDKHLHSMYVWMLGSFSGRGWNEVKIILLPAFLGTVLLLICTLKLDLLTCGEESAFTMGVEVGRLRFTVLLAGSLATSAAVCAGGTIGFVGLIAPHIVRRIFGEKSRTVTTLSMIMGAVILLVSDTVCRLVIAPAEIPVGTVTALIGVPFFISLLLRRKNHGNS